LFLYRYEAGYILKDLHEKSKHNFPLPYAVWHVSYQLFRRSWHTDLDYE
jgi:hypothetical protein